MPGLNNVLVCADHCTITTSKMMAYKQNIAYGKSIVSPR